MYYRDTDAVLFVFDIADNKSFLKVRHWVDEVTSHSTELPLFAIAANKCDLEAEIEVDCDIAEEYANSVGAHLYRTSALTGQGVDNLFFELTDSLLRKGGPFRDSRGK